MIKVHERFLDYVRFDTTADHLSESTPSTEKQKALSEHLAAQLRELGVGGVTVTAQGYVLGEIPATKGAEKLERIGLIAHIDTSPDARGNDIKPRIINNYDGGDVVLNAEKNIVMTPAAFDSLAAHVGEDLIVTDGTTLLGADDKAGIAEIMTAIETVLKNDLPHRAIGIAFTTDEEVGRGVDHFDVKSFGADYAVTVDGGAVDKYSIETFNAAAAVVTVNGVNIHPGSAKNKMINAVLTAMEFNSLLPGCERPDRTEKREGFYHIGSIEGNEERCVMRYILRDHDRARFELRKQTFIGIKKHLDEKYGENTIELKLTDSYYNMGEVLSNRPEIEARVIAAMKAAGIANPEAEPVRGGTDGSRLSFMGLPCPNLPTGGHNGHGRYEYVSIQSMQTVVAMLLELVKPE